jgi:hypothetical protein
MWRQGKADVSGEEDEVGSLQDPVPVELLGEAVGQANAIVRELDDDVPKIRTTHICHSIIKPTDD